MEVFLHKGFIEHVQMLASSTLHFPHYHISHIFTSYHISSLVVIGGQVFSWVILMAYIWYTKYSWVPNANMRWAQSTILSLEIQSPLLMEGGGGGGRMFHVVT